MEKPVGTFGKNTRRAPRAVKLAVRPDHIYYAYGMLVAQERREIRWSEFADMLGVSADAVTRAKQPSGSTSKPLLDALLELRHRGIIFHLADFETSP